MEKITMVHERKEVNITDNSNGSKSKQSIGFYEWDRPETIEELVDQFDKANILKCFAYGKRVELAAEVKAPLMVKKPMSEFEKLFAKLTPEQQAKALGK